MNTVTGSLSGVNVGCGTLFCADALDVMPVDGDVMITDPPYGVSGGSGGVGRASTKTKYDAPFTDNAEYISTVCVVVVGAWVKSGKRAVITPGTPNAFAYPPPDDMGAIYQPAAVGLNKWGRETTQPILFYGKDPRAGLTIQPKHVIATRAAEKNGHPCPKPLYVAEWLVSRGSLEGEVVVDPFMGSGTIGVACQRLGRRYIGIELGPKYFEIAKRRIAEAARQPRLFAEPKMKQTSIFKGAA